MAEEEKETRASDRDQEGRRDGGKKRGRTDEDRHTPTTNTPLNTSRSLILHEVKSTGLFRLPNTRRGAVMGREAQKFCDYHRAKGHITNGCKHLKEDIKKLIQERQLKSYVKKQGEGGHSKRRRSPPCQRSLSPARRNRSPARDRREQPQRPRGRSEPAGRGGERGERPRERNPPD